MGKKNIVEWVLEEISVKLTKLTSLSVIQEEKQNQQIKILVLFGFNFYAIGNLVELPTKSVRRKLEMRNSR